MGIRALGLAGLAGLLALAAHTLLGSGGHALDSFFAGWVYNGVIVAGAALCLSRAALVAAERTAWLILGLGLVAWAAGEITFSIAPDSPDSTSAGLTALQLADQRLYAQRFERRRDAISEQTCDALLQVLHEREPDLRDHVGDVAVLALRVGRRLGLGHDELEDLRRAAELHDVGKSAVPDAILSKPGPLDQREWGFVRQHTLVGERILKAAPALVKVASLVRSSHERFDGGGYPDGLAGDAIPRGARIIAACDAWDAMTTTRPYRHALPRQVALAELRRCSATQFDRAVVAALCAELEATATLATPATAGRA